MIRCRRPAMLASAGAIAALSLIAAGCGGGSSPRVANTPSSTTAASVTAQPGPVGFARCMRSRGVRGFPDPNSSGVFDGSQLKQLGASGQLGASVAQLRAAQRECNYLLPYGVPLAGQTITPAEQADYLRAAACMRSHGFPRFPDPAFHNNGVSVNIPSSINTNAAQFNRAATTCQKFIPRGLPYGGSSGS